MDLKVLIHRVFIILISLLIINTSRKEDVIFPTGAYT